MNEKAISQYLSFILRHKPEEIGLTLDREGWANIEELISKSQPVKNVALDEEIIKNIVSNSDKKRFQISDDGKLIRAVQGHSTTSVDITLNKEEAEAFITELRSLIMQYQEPRHFIFAPHMHLAKD